MLKRKSMTKSARRMMSDVPKNLKLSAVAGAAQGAAEWAGDRLGVRRKRRNVNRMATRGLAAAAVAVPLGFVFGKLLRNRA